MALSWRAKRQLSFLSIFIVFVFLVAFGLIYFLRPAPSCTDGRQNQDEESIDCGGSCATCLSKGEDLITHWTRFFLTSRGQYEIAGFVENPNLLLGTDNLTYRLRLYDANNILIAIREGKTFVNPRERFLIFEKDVETLERVPVRTTLEFIGPDWRRIEKERPQLVVTKKNFVNTETGAELRVSVRNQSLFSVKNVSLAVALMDASGNAIGISTSRVDSIAGEAEREVFFTWRQQFDPPPETIEVVVRTNLTE
jgi:uncharacterized protein (TIGR02588 family)